MRSSARLAVAAAALCVACAGAGGSGSEEPGRAGRAPDFTLRSVDGDTVRLSDYLGKQVVLINFWATWCAPCSGELPHLEQMYRDYRDQGFVVLGVSMDGPETVAEVGAAVRRFGLTYPVLLDEETRVVGALNPKRAAPFNVLIGRDGTIIMVKEGYSAGDEAELESKVKEAL